jgi:hypothetical protein
MMTLKKIGWRGLVALLMPVLALYALTLYTTHGHFTYSLDDPYIHLTLARNIFLGNYGINLSEPSAPSSSIVWPYLMVPFAAAPRLMEYAPLLVNGLCAVLSGCVLVQIHSELRRWHAVGLALAILLCMNVYGLVFTGLEHNLQVLLVLVIAWGLIDPRRRLADPTLHRLFYVCVAALPLVRYEGLAISLPVLLYLFAKGERKQAFIHGALMTAGVAAFSLYLSSKGLGLLPSSVVAKTSSGGGLSGIAINASLNIKKYGFLVPPIALMCLALWPKDKLMAFMLLVITGLHFLFGKYGSFGRYEVYFLMFILPIGLKLLSERSGPSSLLIALAFPFAFTGLFNCTLLTPLAGANIYNQQAQMARIANLLKAPVAVNDLGLVSYRSHRYVLDLWGLGSIEALKLRLAASSSGSPDWMKVMMDRKNVEFAFVFDEWLPKKPDNWQKVADLRLLQRVITPGSDHVGMYATSPEAAAQMKLALVDFTMNNPSTQFKIVFKEQPKANSGLAEANPIHIPDVAP